MTIKLKPGYDDDVVAPRKPDAEKRKANPVTVNTACTATLEPDATALTERDERGAEADIRSPRSLNAPEAY